MQARCQPVCSYSVQQLQAHALGDAMNVENAVPAELGEIDNFPSSILRRDLPFEQPLGFEPIQKADQTGPFDPNCDGQILLLNSVRRTDTSSSSFCRTPSLSESLANTAVSAS